MTTPTPRTDAATAMATVPFEKAEVILVTECVPADFARQLERGLAAAQSEITVRDGALRIAVEQEASLRRDLAAAQEALATRNKQLGVACLKHDLTHSLACGHCLAARDAELAEWKRKAEENARDAGRYRLIRSGMSSGFVVTQNIGHDWIEQIADELDAATDAAIAAKGEA